MTETREKPEHHSGTPGPFVERTRPFWVIVAFAALQVVVGAFVMYGNTQLSNVQAQQRSFSNCQAQYNQDFRTTYDDINAANRAVQDSLFNFLSLIPSLLHDKTTQADVDRFRKATEDYTRLYKQLEEKRLTTKYPEPPENFCRLESN